MKDEFYRKWCMVWIMSKNAKELNQLFEQELNELIKHEINTNQKKQKNGNTKKN